jgi:hypothetical protein
MPVYRRQHPVRRRPDVNLGKPGRMADHQDRHEDAIRSAIDPQ